MTDHFALLEQPRRPLLSLSKLEAVFRGKARTLHPDATGRETDEFRELNAAISVLRDPRKRLAHLLALENASSNQITPAAAEMDLFAEISQTTQNTKAFLDGNRITDSAISRSVALARQTKLRRALEEAQEKIRTAMEQSEAELAQLDEAWNHNRASAIGAAAQLQQRFTFLGRWSETLAELRFRLTH
ncbi:MAG: hypothetical protein M3R59_07650 [Verrucomicrobiota bacterium]|nr:hypothetical protein [Verrucomicrobiota bacterium]